MQIAFTVKFGESSLFYGNKVDRIELMAASGQAAVDIAKLVNLFQSSLTIDEKRGCCRWNVNKITTATTNPVARMG